MKWILISLYFFTILISCKEEIELLGNPSLSELENYTRHNQDHKATHTFSQYEELLKKLSEEKYIVLPIVEFKDSINDSKVLVGMRHDIDHHPFKALEMAELEHSYNILATYYVLATSTYYGKFTHDSIRRYDCMEYIYNELYNSGHEIGVHNDLLTVMIKHKLDPFEFNKNELVFYGRLGIKIYGTAAHGSRIARKTVSNFQIFSDFAKSSYVEYKGKKYRIGEYSLQEYGFEYKAYFTDFNKYYSECGGTWNLEDGFDQLLSKLENSQPGDRIQILTHPVWWGK
jgi:hypothetical protein